MYIDCDSLSFLWSAHHKKCLESHEQEMERAFAVQKYMYANNIIIYSVVNTNHDYTYYLCVCVCVCVTGLRAKRVASVRRRFTTKLFLTGDSAY